MPRPEGDEPPLPRTEAQIRNGWGGATPPLVSVLCVTHNQEHYIAAALDGCLAQETTFPFEVVVHDDASTDATPTVVADYVARYPSIVRLVRPRENQYSQGRRIIRLVWPLATGKYVALCEGDDYWSDPRKLQLQADLLESRPDVSLCFHPVTWLDQATGRRHLTYYGAPGERDWYCLDDLLEHSNFIPTASVLIRSGVLRGFPDWFDQSPIGDLPLHVLTLTQAPSDRIACIQRPMSIYRRHATGTHGGCSRRINLTRTLRTYELLGQIPEVRTRLAYQVGVGRRLAELLTEYRREGNAWASLRVAATLLKLRAVPLRARLALLAGGLDGHRGAWRRLRARVSLGRVLRIMRAGLRRLRRSFHGGPRA